MFFIFRILEKIAKGENKDLELQFQASQTLVERMILSVRRHMLLRRDI